MNKAEQIEIMDGRKMSRAMTRIAHEILEHNGGADSLVIVGILTRGAVLARKLAEIIKGIEGVEVPVGLMDINLYRDDINFNPDQPVVRTTEIMFDIDEKNLILVDDVLYTGRTIRAALSQMIDFGRPATIQLAVMVDRGHRQLPIRADYVGKNIPTSFEDNVRVYFEEQDGKDEVILYPAPKKNSKEK
ncbi:MAG: bifunctional pyr operon transcriptional regulator/uracil phosphoribosyltransferase PyrR [Candidatus Zixiibacteriota bacterium]